MNIYISTTYLYVYIYERFVKVKHILTAKSNSNTMGSQINYVNTLHFWVKKYKAE